MLTENIIYYAFSHLPLEQATSYTVCILLVSAILAPAWNVATSMNLIGFVARELLIIILVGGGGGNRNLSDQNIQV